MRGVEGRPTRAEVDLGCIAHNLRLARAAVGREVAVLAVVKADAYGHGAVPVARAALAAGADRLGVATIEEAVALRQSGIAAPVLIMGWTPPWQLEPALDLNITLTLFSTADARAVSEVAVRRGRRARIHVKVDTGMGRLGFPAADGTAAEIAALCRLPGLEAEGIYTHFAASDSDREFTLGQLERFQAVLRELRTLGVAFPVRHAANSGAVWDVPEAHLDMVRLGIGLYGYHPAGPGGEAAGGGPAHRPALRPALTWRTAVAQVKEVPPGTPVSYGRTYLTRGWERLATLPVGYADGYSRGFSNRGVVLIGGRRARVTGRVCMDQIVVSVPAGVEVQQGDEAVLIGRQGDEVLTADDLAGWLGTISYEVLCAIGKRVPRHHRGHPATGARGAG